MERPVEGLGKATCEFQVKQTILRQGRHFVQLVDGTFNRFPRRS